ncbi:uncharacterized protein [Rutidosis leptorrhynchoides]|uniref:uncharacterized protein isoform X2 n=1 Tax=Rutidosis leptorrhynchoides TaxID=125765 RepID=UPI003A99319F
MRSYRDNGGGGARNTTVYDDVFGGPPKFGATTLPPRIEDYTEIFQGFHASRGSSIPVLDLPSPADDSEFDVCTSKLDYTEVFGSFNCIDFAVSYEELFKTSEARNDDEDSSDDVWTPAQSELLSDESDPYASLETNQQSFAADHNQLLGVKSQNKCNLEPVKDGFNEMTNISQFHDVPKSTVLDDHSIPSKTDNDTYFSLANNDLNAIKVGKLLKKSLSQPLDNVDGAQRYESNSNQKPYPEPNRSVYSVSDLGLKTQPSHLPPPSRPPPVLTSKKGHNSNFNPKLKTSKSYAFERMKGDQSPPYFDVEIDASSSAVADAAAMKDAVQQAQAKLKSAKESMERKKDGLQSRSKLKKGQVDEDYERLNNFGGDGLKGSYERDDTLTRHEVREENVNDKDGILETNVSSRGSKKNYNVVLESFELKDNGDIVRERQLRGLRENNKRQDNGKTPNDSDENESFENLIEIQLKDNGMEIGENVVIENWLNNDNGRYGDEMGPASYVWEDYDVGLEEAIEENHEREFQQSFVPEISMRQSEVKAAHEREGEKIVKDPFEWDEHEKLSMKASEQEQIDVITQMFSEQGKNVKKQTLDHNDKILLEDFMHEEDKIKAEEATEEEGACVRDERVQANEKVKTIHENENMEGEVSECDDIDDDQDGFKLKEHNLYRGESSEASDLVFQVDDDVTLQTTEDLQQDVPNQKSEATPEIANSVENHRDNLKVEETVEQVPKVGEEPISSSGSNQNDLQSVKDEVGMEDETYSNSLNGIGKIPPENDKKTNDLTFESKNAINLEFNHGARGQARVQPEGTDTTTINTTSLPVAKDLVESRTKPQKDKVDSFKSTNRSMEMKTEIHNKAVSENRGKEERLQRVRELENERLRKIEEERERQIEREKDRMAVDRATLEAREKAFAETRERSERAAVERATAEFRQRALAEARERLEKACAEAREKSLAEKAMEGRLRVEKATAEARGRAERSVSDKFSAYQNSGMRQNSLPSDLAGSYSGLRYSQSVAPGGGEDESPQRCKARLERHQRTADRAAKALEEKNMRDLVAQKEQAERSRLAESLDAEVKRWSNGKQGNLRALLSTLQYILGSDSGWQPVPLTEVITTAAVKKAYRKATLCVHPDKLQQRGATIHQKYICEKVFDLLKEAWNKFNSEVR